MHDNFCLIEHTTMYNNYMHWYAVCPKCEMSGGVQ